MQLGSFYMLKGIVSSGTLQKDTKACDVGRVNIYTNVNDYRDWISTITKKDFYHY